MTEPYRTAFPSPAYERAHRQGASALIWIVALATMLPSLVLQAEKIPIDQVPMYGGLDRAAIPELKQADDIFIGQVTDAYGGREEAGEAWVEQAFRFFEAQNFEKAMARFNQAWLLDPENPDVYWGFSAVLYEKGDTCGAMEIARKAEEVGIESMILPNQVVFLADLGMMMSACASGANTKRKRSKKLIEEADARFLRAESIWQSAYLYDKWWQALYWRGDYAGAWEKVDKMRQKGEEPHPPFLRALQEAMPEPE